jgi:hypothetical protein
VPWSSDTLPWVTVGFLGPAFDENSKDSAAMELLAALYFGQTSDLYKQLVVTEQKVDELDVDVPASVDAALFTVLAGSRTRRTPSTCAIASSRRSRPRAPHPIATQRLEDAKSFDRYSLSRTIDSTERVAAVVSAYVHFKRSFDTINNRYRTLGSLTPSDVQSAARKYFTDQSLIVATLARDRCRRHRSRAGAGLVLERRATAAGRAAPTPSPPPTCRPSCRNPHCPRSPSSCCSPSVPRTIPRARKVSTELTAAMLTRAGRRG